MEYFAAWHNVSSPMEHWLPSTSPNYKINFDMAIWDTFWAQAAVCRNHQGHIINMISKTNPPCLANYGEALAARVMTQRKR
jgi:hypothetical protein